MAASAKQSQTHYQKQKMLTSTSITLWAFRVIEPLDGEDEETGKRKRDDRMWASDSEPLSMVRMHLLGDKVITFILS